MQYDGLLDRSGCTRILLWCIHLDLRWRFLEQSECRRFTIPPRHVSRCPAILQRQTEVVRKKSGRINLTQFE